MHHSWKVISKTVHRLRKISFHGEQTSSQTNNFSNQNMSKFYSSKAAFCHDINGPLIIEETKEKKLKQGEVKIKVKYCGLNKRDSLLLKGKIDGLKTPFVPGYEVAGEVVEKLKGEEDDSESTIEVGDKVVALTKSSLGGLCSHCIALEKDVWKYNSLNPKDAVGLTVNYGTALLGLFRRAKIKKSSTILVTADSGGLGIAALDIAANVYKAKVVGVCGSEEKADLLRERGAWSALKMDLSNLKASVQDVTEKKGVDIAFETVGGDFLIGSLQCVKHEGHLIIADANAADVIKPANLFKLRSFNTTAISLEQYREHDFPAYRQAVADVIELCEQNLISPYSSKSFELDHVNDAVKVLNENHFVGKVIVKIS